jgi:DnaJ-class molecular chaperone
MIKRLTIIFGFLFFIVAETNCSSSEKNNIDKPAAPKIDLSTPENAIKSRWALKRSTEVQRLQSEQASPENSLYEERARRTKLDSLDKRIEEAKRPDPNTIENVRLETENRAVVITKEELYSGSKDKREHKYVLSRSEGKWLVENASELCFSCNGTGKEIDMKRISEGSPYPKKQCDYCKGVGYRSEIYE